LPTSTSVTIATTAPTTPPPVDTTSTMQTTSKTIEPTANPMTASGSSSSTASSSSVAVIQTHKRAHFLEFVGVAVGVTFTVVLALVVWYYRFKKGVAYSFNYDLVSVRLPLLILSLCNSLRTSLPVRLS
jgi:hypothetical protein